MNPDRCLPCNEYACCQEVTQDSVSQIWQYQVISQWLLKDERTCLPFQACRIPLLHLLEVRTNDAGKATVRSAKLSSWAPWSSAKLPKMCQVYLEELSVGGQITAMAPWDAEKTPGGMLEYGCWVLELRATTFRFQRIFQKHDGMLMLWVLKCFEDDQIVQDIV